MKPKYTSLVQKSLSMIESDYMYYAGISEIADVLGVSKNHLIREFTRQVGVSPNRHLVRHKLTQAKILLMDEENFSIEIVAQMTGFSSGNYFAKVFKKEYNLTPTEYVAGIDVKKQTPINMQLYV